MAVLTFLVRADGRRRWRSLAGLTLLVTGVVAAVLTSLATAWRTETVVHASAVTVRRRRHDLAVLRVLGVSSRGLRQAVSIQVAALALVGSVIGVVLGVGLGRQLWDAVAEATSLPTVIEFPVLAVVLVPLAIAVLAQLGAVLSRHAAGRIPAAVALRVE